jgi:hypothetical protein
MSKLQTEFSLHGKVYVRNGGTDGVDVELFGVRTTRWTGPDGEELVGERRVVHGKPYLTVTQGDAGLFRELERLFWEVNVTGLKLDQSGTGDTVH